MAASIEGPVLVYDVGGSHVSAAVCHADGFRLGPLVAAPHPPEASSGAFVRVLHAIGMQALAGIEPVQGAELAVPGPFDFAAGISLMRHKLPYLYGVDLRGALAASFGWRPGNVRFLLDSAAFLLGEAGAGAARGVHRAVGVTLGTGVGSALAVDGRLVTEGLGVPPGGEIWNLPYEGGIVEDFVSTRAIRDGYQVRTGELREVKDLATMAAADAEVREVFAEFGRHLGTALSEKLASFAPEVIVLGGAISRSAQLFLPVAQRYLNGMTAELRISELGDDAPLVGAGVAWFNGCDESKVEDRSSAAHSNAD